MQTATGFLIPLTAQPTSCTTISIVWCRWLCVSSAKKLPETIIGVGTAKRELAEENFARFLKVYENSQDIRRLGSAALELAYTACSRQCGYFEVYLNPWDYAAGMLLIQEAGGKVTDWKGNALDPAQGSQVCGTNGQVHEELLKLLL